MTGGAVGKVVASHAPELPVGTWVQSELGWREYALGPAKFFRKIDVSQAPPSAYLGVLGSQGLTAYVGLHDIGGLRPDDVVFISSAAGTVGSIAGQLAKYAGATVIGSAGGHKKVAYLKDELGFDAAFDYHEWRHESKTRGTCARRDHIVFRQRRRRAAGGSAFGIAAVRPHRRLRDDLAVQHADAGPA